MLKKIYKILGLAILIVGNNSKAEEYKEHLAFIKESFVAEIHYSRNQKVFDNN